MTTTTAPLRATERRWRRLTAVRHRGRAVDLVAIGLLALLVLIALLAPLIAPYSPVLRSGAPFLAPGASGHLLGTDALGYDVLSRVLYGMRASLVAAFLVIVSGVVFGSLVGLLAGALGRWADNLLMRFTDLFLAMPGLVIALAVAASLGRGYWSALLGIAVVWWPMYARLVRGEVRSWAARPHLEAAVIAGVGWWRRTFRHLLPGVTSTIIVTASLDIGGLIVALSALSFLGLSSPAPAPELGAMAAQGSQYLLQYWWIPVLPGLTVALIAFLANLAGDGIRDLVSR